MKCPNCKFELPDDSDFCNYCGIVFATVEPRKEAPPAPEPPIEEPKKKPAQHAHSHKTEQRAAEAAAAEPQYPADVYDPYGLSADPYGHGSTQHSKTQTGTHEQYCELCGGRIDRARRKCTSCGKHYPLPRRVLPLAILGVAVAASLFANVIQYNNYRHSSSNMSHNLVEREDTIALQADTLSRNEDTISAQANTISGLEDTISKQQTEIDELNVKVAENKEKADTYDKMHEALNTAGTGHGSVNFHASESVIFVKKSEKNRTFTLTADLGDNVGAGVYYMPETNPSAKVKFDTARFSKTTTLTVVPHEVGMTTVTFFNDKNSEKFNVIIIVTE